jgi:hypothetical protein
MTIYDLKMRISVSAIYLNRLADNHTVELSSVFGNKSLF